MREREIETTETVLQQTLCCVVGEQLPGGEVCVDEGLGAVGGKQSPAGEVCGGG